MTLTLGVTPRSPARKLPKRTRAGPRSDPRGAPELVTPSRSTHRHPQEKPRALLLALVPAISSAARHCAQTLILRLAAHLIYLTPPAGEQSEQRRPCSAERRDGAAVSSAYPTTAEFKGLRIQPVCFYVHGNIDTETTDAFQTGVKRFRRISNSLSHPHPTPKLRERNGPGALAPKLKRAQLG
ncbi:hypothetical protein SKAU_G00187310 [Synaphobranchus kaupii]|uniref:Uncharacterized protein n=1 Tax=Synaphobranchus kaupii TaxID=118154 RepID=A0A9Q1FD01_SYNKA|nr:hypothetical protein SKAU_G00187310 [Synaphobranchus kaupii]